MSHGIFNSRKQALIAQPIFTLMWGLGVMFSWHAYTNPGAFGPIFGPTADALAFILIALTFFGFSYLQHALENEPLHCRLGNHDFKGRNVPVDDGEPVWVERCQECGAFGDEI